MKPRLYVPRDPDVDTLSRRIHELETENEELRAQLEDLRDPKILGAWLLRPWGEEPPALHTPVPVNGQPDGYYAQG